MFEGKDILYFAAVFSAVLTFSSCTGEDDKDGYSNLGAPIAFEAEYYDVTLKGTEINTGNISSFGVYAALEPNDNDFLDGDAELSVFMDNVPVRKTGSLWLADPIHYWPVLQDKKLSFFAYTPYSDRADVLDVEADWDNKTVTLTYTPGANPKDHLDLCTANAVLDRKKDDDGDGIEDPVEFSFDHTLTWISFAANYIGELPSGCTLQIDELTISNLLNCNTLVGKFEGDVLKWTWSDPVGAERSGRYTMSRAPGDETLGNVPLNPRNAENTNHREFQTARGYLYALPQTINPAGISVPATMALTFSYVRTDGSIIAQFFTEMNLPSDGVWDPGKKVKYIFTIDVTTASLIQLSAVSGGTWITDWQPSGNVHVDKEIK